MIPSVATLVSEGECTRSIFENERIWSMDVSFSLISYRKGQLCRFKRFEVDW